MPKRRKRKKKPQYPVERGRQLYRAICILDQIRKRKTTTLSRITDSLPQWCSRTIRRDLQVLESLGWVRKEIDAFGVPLWSFVAITEVQADGIALVSDSSR
jgi:DNA-binding HxlR family transcriptional regulator